MDLLRPVLLPMTRNLPTPINNFLISLLGPDCHQLLISELSLTSPACLKLAVSKALGVGIIGASSVVKVPQILKLLSSGSASGVSFLSYALETLSFVISLAYNVRHGFPFSTYGETAMIVVQNVVIACLVLGLQGRKTGAAAFVAGLASLAWALLGGGGGGGGVAQGKAQGVVGLETLRTLQMGAAGLSVLSKIPQIWTIWQQGATGQLSAFTVFNYLAGSMSRIFTTLQEVDDKLILYGFVAGFVLNAVLAAQMLYYWNARPTGVKKVGGRRDVERERQVPMGVGLGTGSAAGVKSASTRRRG
ncbi:MAG: hypothetical protein M1816_005333 [Peltula sp. TS41687]|nr:MAG: hypothetical protein M1816_005333 [Peltula sp. TS41687]